MFDWNVFKLKRLLEVCTEDYKRSESDDLNIALLSTHLHHFVVNGLRLLLKLNGYKVLLTYDVGTILNQLREYSEHEWYRAFRVHAVKITSWRNALSMADDSVIYRGESLLDKYDDVTLVFGAAKLFLLWLTERSNPGGDPADVFKERVSRILRSFGSSKNPDEVIKVLPEAAIAMDDDTLRYCVNVTVACLNTM